MERALSSLAWNMRRHRAIRGLSASEVARRSQVARATLTQLEAGRGNPTLDTLLAVASVLGISLAELVTEDPPPALTLVSAADDDDGAAYAERFLRRFPPSPCLVDFHELRLQAGVTHVEPALGYGTHKHIVVHTGRLLLRAGPEPAAHRDIELGPGDYVVFAADSEHQYRATEDAVRATLIIHTPGSDGRSSSNGAARPSDSTHAEASEAPRGRGRSGS